MFYFRILFCVHNKTKRSEIVLLFNDVYQFIATVIGVQIDIKAWSSTVNIVNKIKRQSDYKRFKEQRSLVLNNE